MKTCNVLRNKAATTYTFIINYVFRIKNNECAALQFLTSFLEENGKFYNNPSEMSKAFNSLFGSRVNTIINPLGKLAIVTVQLVVPHEKFIGEDVFKKALELLKDYIEDISESRYQYSMLEAHKKELIKYAKELENRAVEMGKFQVFSQIQPRAKVSRPSYQKISDIEKVNINILKNIHQRMLSGYTCIFAESPSPVSKTKKTILSVFKPKNKKVSNSFELFDSEEVKISEKTQKDIPQSAVYLLYNYPSVDSHLMSLFNTAVNNELFEVVREKHGYCYFINSNLLLMHNLLLIRAHTSLKHVDNTVDLITAIMKNFHVDEVAFESAKLKRNNQLETILENAKDLNMFMVIRKLLMGNTDIHKEIETVDKTEIKSVNGLQKNLKLISVVRVKGVNDNEN